MNQFHKKLQNLGKMFNNCKILAQVIDINTEKGYFFVRIHLFGFGKFYKTFAKVMKNMYSLKQIIFVYYYFHLLYCENVPSIFQNIYF